MNKNVKRIISMVLTIVMLASMFCVVFAIPEIGQAPTTEKMKSARDKVLGFIKWVGYAFAVGMLLYIGIKYVIGAVLVAGAVTIVEFIANIGGGVPTGEGG